ncbi:hypothetical protein GCM10019016_113220 [Streptomyces prasinosporus]|uniref:Uncharacterized protein n=1 Tax=Streptomyces prasinosporus TaxID=68256 RepID=A0ABP6U9S1_9ACTN|nr:hypothetical protein GCM10010332_25200 [Streptomyces albogriseolus]
MSYRGIAAGSLPPEHYWHVFRTLLPGTGREQEPEGARVTIDCVRVWQGHYTHRGRKPSPPGAGPCPRR